MALFEELVAPWPDWDGLANLTEDEVVTRLDEQVRAAAATPEGKVAAVGLIVAVGNYEWASGRRSPVVLNAANALMDEFAEPVQSWRWG